MSQKICIEDLEQEVTVLRLENDIKRILLSESANELLSFVKDHEKEDFFICKTDRVNFFRDRSGPCNLL